MPRKKKPLTEEESQSHTNKRIDNRENNYLLLDPLFDEDDFWETEGQHYGSK